MADPYARDYFTSESAKSADQFDRYAELLRQQRIEPSALRTCDIGCAEGAIFASALRGCEAYGVDISNHAVEACRAGFPELADRVEVVDLSFDQPSFEVDFDLVTCFDVIEHLENFLALRQFLQARVRPGGHLLLTTPNAFSLLRLLRLPYSGDMDPTHTHLFTPYTLDFWLTRAGFRRMTLCTPFAFMPTVAGLHSRLGLGGQIVALYRH